EADSPFWDGAAERHLDHVVVYGRHARRRPTPVRDEDRLRRLQLGRVEPYGARSFPKVDLDLRPPRERRLAGIERQEDRLANGRGASVELQPGGRRRSGRRRGEAKKGRAGEGAAEKTREAFHSP